MMMMTPRGAAERLRPYAVFVTFLELADQLGVARGKVNMHPKGSFFRLPWLPVDRFKEWTGGAAQGGQGGRFRGRVKIEGAGEREVIQVPVAEGLALIAGTIRLEDDGSQTLVDAVAVLKRPGE